MEKGNKKIIRGWVFYDWANSVYNLVISSAIFPIFYDLVTKHYYKENILHDSDYELAPGETVLVDFFGFQLSSTVLFPFVIATSFLIVAFLSPVLSGVADYSGNKKRFLQFFCYLGSLSCISLFWFDVLPLELGMISVFFAKVSKVSKVRGGVVNNEKRVFLYILKIAFYR